MQYAQVDREKYTQKERQIYRDRYIPTYIKFYLKLIFKYEILEKEFKIYLN